MTGFGEAKVECGPFAATVEIRTLNNRFLKVIPSLPEGFTNFAPQVEQIIRQRLRRGTVHVYIRLQRTFDRPRWRINEQVFEAYMNQLAVLRVRWGFPESLTLQAILGLPGVVEAQGSEETETELVWPMVEKALGAALDQVEKSRRAEGAATLSILREMCAKGLELLGRIERQAPLTVAAYRERFEERLRQLLTSVNVVAGEVDILREVASFADRVDIGEEVVRLRGHFHQFLNLLEAEECSGRQLDFLAQEMHREASTIGAKAADGQISHWVVEIKTVVERLREIVQNLE